MKQNKINSSVCTTPHHSIRYYMHITTRWPFQHSTHPMQSRLLYRKITQPTIVPIIFFSVCISSCVCSASVIVKQKYYTQQFSRRRKKFSFFFFIFSFHYVHRKTWSLLHVVSILRARTIRRRARFKANDSTHTLDVTYPWRRKGYSSLTVNVRRHTGTAYFMKKFLCYSFNVIQHIII